MGKYADIRAAVSVPNLLRGDLHVTVNSRDVHALLAERDAMRGRLEAAANYIDTLGGDSKGLRSALAQEQGD